MRSFVTIGWGVRGQHLGGGGRGRQWGQTATSLMNCTVLEMGGGKGEKWGGKGEKRDGQRSAETHTGMGGGGDILNPKITISWVIPHFRAVVAVQLGGAVCFPPHPPSLPINRFLFLFPFAAG